MRSGEPRAGFTLLEVLAALVVTAAFVAVALPYGGRLVARWWRGETTVEVADIWAQTIARMSLDLAEAIPLVLDRSDGPVVAFEADATTFTFLRPALSRPRGLESVTYEIASTASGSALVRRTTSFDPDAFGRAMAGKGASATLVDGPFRFRIGVIALDGTRHSDWTLSDQMPTRIEISVTGTGKSPPPAALLALPIVARPSLSFLPRRTPPARPPLPSEPVESR